MRLKRNEKYPGRFLAPRDDGQGRRGSFSPRYNSGGAQLAACRGRCRVGERRPSRARLFTEPDRSPDLGNRRPKEHSGARLGENV